MKDLFNRLTSWRSTAVAVVLFAGVAALHFSGRVLVTEWVDFLTGFELLVGIIATRYLLMIDAPQGFAAPPEEEEPTDPPTTPLPNPSTPRPPKK